MVDLSPIGFRSTQRLRTSDCADSVALATWPAELKPQITYRTSAPGKRLYMCPPIAPLDYVARWEDEEALSRIGGNYAREDIEQESWPWLKQQGFADDGDDAELLRFLDEFLGSWPANMRPGLRFRRVWTFAEAAELGSALAETIRSEFDTVFAIAHEPALGSAEIAGLEA